MFKEMASKPDLTDIETLPGEQTMEQRLEERERSWGSVDVDAKRSIERLHSEFASRVYSRVDLDMMSITQEQRDEVWEDIGGHQVLRWVLTHWDFVWERIDH